MPKTFTRQSVRSRTLVISSILGFIAAALCFVVAFLSTTHVTPTDVVYFEETTAIVMAWFGFAFGLACGIGALKRNLVILGIGAALVMVAGIGMSFPYTQYIRLAPIGVPVFLLGFCSLILGIKAKRLKT